MNNLVVDIHRIIKAYRAGDPDALRPIDLKHIKKWIAQFDHQYRRPILVELRHILKKRYCSKTKARNLLEKLVVEMAFSEGFRSVRGFLF